VIIRSNLRSVCIAALLCAGGLSLTACASGAGTAEMTVAATSSVASVNAGQPGYQALTVTDVTGGTKTNPLWASKVSSEDFKAALEASLKAKGYLAADGSSAKIKVSAALVGLKQPMAGLDMSVTSQVHYVVTNAATGAKIFDDLVANTGTATMGEALIGAERLKKANEHSIQGNIESFINRLAPTLPAK
jgi:hypothetical protein